MKKISGSLKIFVLTVALYSVTGFAHAGLVYSGENLSVGGGAMTITAMDGDTMLWELDLTRYTSGQRRKTVSFTRFAPVAGVNVAPEGNWADGLWRVGEGTVENSGDFAELVKTPDMYSFKLTHVPEGSNHGLIIETVFRIHAPGRRGTRWTATVTTRNTSKSDVIPYTSVSWELSLTDGGYGLDKGYTLDGTSGGANRYVVKRGSPDGPWIVNENVDSGANNMDSDGFLWGKITVRDNTASRKLSLPPGLQFFAGSDVRAYYPTANIGDANLQSENNDSIFVNATPREFMGLSRADHVALKPGESYTANLYLDINISVKGGASVSKKALVAPVPVQKKKESSVVKKPLTVVVEKKPEPVKQPPVVVVVKNPEPVKQPPVVVVVKKPVPVKQSTVEPSPFKMSSSQSKKESVQTSDVLARTETFSGISFVVPDRMGMPASRLSGRWIRSAGINWEIVKTDGQKNVFAKVKSSRPSKLLYVISDKKKRKGRSRLSFDFIKTRSKDLLGMKLFATDEDVKIGQNTGQLLMGEETIPSDLEILPSAYSWDTRTLTVDLGDGYNYIYVLFMGTGLGTTGLDNVRFVP